MAAARRTTPTPRARPRIPCPDNWFDERLRLEVRRGTRTTPAPPDTGRIFVTPAPIPAQLAAHLDADRKTSGPVEQTPRTVRGAILLPAGKGEVNGWRGERHEGGPGPARPPASAGRLPARACPRLPAGGRQPALPGRPAGHRRRGQPEPRPRRGGPRRRRRSRSRVRRRRRRLLLAASPGRPRPPGRDVPLRSRRSTAPRKTRSRRNEPPPTRTSGDVAGRVWSGGRAARCALRCRGAASGYSGPATAKRGSPGFVAGVVTTKSTTPSPGALTSASTAPK